MVEIRRATSDDYDGVVAMTEGLWEEYGGDYLPRVYQDWLEDDDEPKKTFLAELDGTVVGIVQVVMLSSDEAWFQGMRVHPDYRRQGVSRRLNEATFEWARERDATVGRVMIFSWNTVSLGATRRMGFEPLTSFRFAHPEPDADAEPADGYAVADDPAAAWRYWTHDDARDHLRGLGLAPEDTWAMREVTREDFSAFADERAVFAVEGEGLEGAAYRTRVVERTDDDGTETRLAEYGVATWEDVPAARALFAGIARDAAALGADRTRVLIPETARHVTDAAAAGADLADEPDFVLGIDLTE